VHASRHRQNASHSADDPQVRASSHALLVAMHFWQAGAASGSLRYPAKPPQERPHAVSQVDERHALSADTGAALAAGTGWSIVQFDRQAGSPLHAPKQLS
jgi:hypothetical protein